MLSLRHLKVLALIVGMLVIGFGRDVGFQEQEATAHPHTVIQSTVTWTTWEWYWTLITPITGTDLKGHTVTGTNYQPIFVHVTYTTYYVDDGHSVHQKTVRTEGRLLDGIDWDVWHGCGHYECAQYVSN